MKKYLIFLVSFITLLANDLQTIKPIKKDIRTNNIVSGVVYAQNEQIISTRNSGFISSLKVEEGDFVKKGEIVARIDPIEISTKISSAKSNLEISESTLNVVRANQLKAQADLNIKKQILKDALKDYNRYQILYAQNAISKREFDKKLLEKSIAEDNLKIAQNNLKVANKEVLMAKSGISVASSGLKNVKNELKYTYLSAQFDGVVVEKSKNINEVVMPGMQILKIASLEKLRVKAMVQENDISHINIGDIVKIEISSLKKIVQAKVAVKSSQGNALTHTYEVKFDLPSKDLLPGMFTKVYIQSAKQTLFTIPTSALTIKSGISGVFVKKENKLFFKDVRVEYKSADFLGIVGVEEDDEILLYPKAGYRDGMSL